LFRTLANIFKIPELRTKLLFTVAMLCVYRIGFYVPLPGVDTHMVSQFVNGNSSSAVGQISNYLSLFSGGGLGYSTLFGLGIMPYISAAIIFQLLGTVIPSLEKLQKEGEPGMRKINEWTRYATVVLCVIQAFVWLRYLTTTSPSHPHGFLYKSMFYNHLLLFWVTGICALTAGSIFLMWLGEQIDAYGIGNGVSLIIMAGIVSRIPSAIDDLWSHSTFHLGGNAAHRYGIGTMLFLIAAFVCVSAGAVILEQAQRRIAIQQAKHVRGNRVYGGQLQYLPLRVNHGGVMPIIFASSLMLIPSVVLKLSFFTVHFGQYSWFQILVESIQIGAFFYIVAYVAMIFFFSYFWNTVQFQPKEMAEQLQDYGSFIKGLRPGKRTAEYLENVMARVTYCGAAFLAVIALVPTVVSNYLGINFMITQFLGGTGLLITVSVMLDFINRVEANLVMRNYGGLTDGPSGMPAPRRPSGGRGSGQIGGNIRESTA
jgi:preprotein translocase subunit SecY